MKWDLVGQMGWDILVLRVHTEDIYRRRGRRVTLGGFAER